MNALQGTDLAVDGLNTALASYVGRRQENARDEAVNDANKVWAVVAEWERYATALEQQNRQIARRLASLEGDGEKQAAASFNALKAISRYQHLLVCRIKELDQRYQEVSAENYGLRRRIRRDEMHAAGEANKSGGSPVVRRGDRNDEFRSDIGEFMRTIDVRLGVPELTEALRE